MYKFNKRLFDIVSSSIACIILAPLLLPIVILLRLTSEREVFYLQERIGLNKKPFMIYKFATMLKNSPNMKGGIITTENDPRVTFMGGFLRKSKINELPQLINILIGDMSVVGPRPVMKASFETYSSKIQEIIYNVKPGLTGIGSIIFRDEEELISNVKNNKGDVWDFYKNTIFPFKGEVEIWYQKNKSFFLDIKLIFITAWVVFFPNSTIYEKLFRNLPKRSF
jgi:lipopolysaccharide/colanic/teichoic acid biosynthesis glycosyltransferase